MSRRKHNDLFKLKIVKEYEEWSISCYKLAQKYGYQCAELWRGSLPFERSCKNKQNSPLVGNSCQWVAISIPICDIVKAQGDRTSQCLFSKGDYIDFLVNKYCKAGRR